MKDTYSTENIKKIRWGVLEENQPISLFPTMYPGWCGIIEKTGGILGMPQKNIINLNRKNNGIIFIDHDEWNRLGKFALQKILKNPAWGLALNKKILKLSDELVTFTSRKIFSKNLKSKSPKELFSLYKTYLEKHSNLYNHSIVPVYLDLYKPHLTSHVTNYLQKQSKKTKYHLTGKECFALVSVPEKFSKVQEEEKALLLLASNHTSKNYKTALAKHTKKFAYLGYNFEGPAFPYSYFEKRLREFWKNPIHPKQRLAKLNAEKAVVAKNRTKLTKDLKIDKRNKLLLEITRGFIFSKDYRKMSLVQSYYETEPLLSEIARRCKLTLAEIRNCLVPEVLEMLTGKITKPTDLSKRMQGCLLVVVNQNLPGRVFAGHQFREMGAYLLKKEDFGEINYFHGQPACLGRAKGTVKIINSVKDMRKMRRGDILVTQMTNPDLVPAMKMAGAIVTDLGGITSHAAIVSREMNVPCVIGTKIATKVLKDGDMIEVDANSGDIRKL